MEFRVLFDFVPEEEGELEVGTGDLLFQLEPDCVDECPPGWIFVRKDLGNGVVRCGYVPRDFLQLVGSSSSRAATHDETTTAPAKHLTSSSEVNVHHRSRETESSSSNDPSSMAFPRGGKPLSLPASARPDDHPPATSSANKIVDISHFLPPGSSTPLRGVTIPSTPMVATRGGPGTETSSTISSSSTTPHQGYISFTAAASVHRAVVTDTTTSDLIDITRRAESLFEQILSSKSELVAELSSLSRQLSASAQASDELLRSISLAEVSLDSEIAILAEVDYKE